MRKFPKPPHTPAAAPLTQRAGEREKKKVTTSSMNVRGICKELVTEHTTEVKAKLLDGMLSSNPKTSMKFLTFITDRAEGKPVQTTRVAEVNDPLDEALAGMSTEELRAECELLLAQLKNRSAE